MQTNSASVQLSKENEVVSNLPAASGRLPAQVLSTESSSFRVVITGSASAAQRESDRNGGNNGPFQKIIGTHLDRYMAASKDQKPAIVTDIIQTVCATGGMFVEKNGTASTAAVRSFVSNELRDTATKAARRRFQKSRRDRRWQRALEGRATRSVSMTALTRDLPKQAPLLPSRRSMSLWYSMSVLEQPFSSVGLGDLLIYGDEDDLSDWEGTNDFRLSSTDLCFT